MNFRTSLLAGTTLCALVAGSAFADTSGKRIALSNGYAGNA